MKLAYKLFTMHLLSMAPFIVSKLFDTKLQEQCLSSDLAILPVIQSDCRDFKMFSPPGTCEEDVFETYSFVNSALPFHSCNYVGLFTTNTSVIAARRCSSLWV